MCQESWSTSLQIKSIGLFSNAYALLILATLGWGCNAVAGKLATSGWEPFTLTFSRWLLVALVLLPFAWTHVQRDSKLIAKHWLFFLLFCGSLMALFNLLMYLALNHTTAINVSIEQASMPLFIILANFLVFSQRVSALQIVGVCLSIFGVLVTSTNGEPLKILENGLNRGDSIMLVGCFFYAVYTFALRWKPDVHWLTFIFLIAIGATLISFPFSMFEFFRVSMSMPSGSDWLILIFVVLVPSIICQLCFARGVELIGGNRAGLFINLVPLFGSLLAVLIIGEQFQWFHAVGLVMVVGGIMLAERFARTD